MADKIPAPRTFAPSREDVLSTLGFFFGDPAVPEKLKDYSEHRTFPALSNNMMPPLCTLYIVCWFSLVCRVARSQTQ
tara:strand:- start:857 stop:1087 length:231 start_codon:yes stop_codon:yes gene_type:complete